MFTTHLYNKNKKVTQTKVSTTTKIDVIENLLSVSYSDSFNYNELKQIYLDIYSTHHILKSVLSVVAVSASKNTANPLTISFEQEDATDHTTSFYLPSDNHIVILTKTDYKKLLGTISHEFTHKALTALYRNLDNIGAPYKKESQDQKKKFAGKIKDYLTNIEKYKEPLFATKDYNANKENSYQYGKYIIENLQNIKSVFPVLEEPQDCDTELSLWSKIFNTASDSYLECLEKQITKNQERREKSEKESEKVQARTDTIPLVRFYLENYKTTDEHKEVAVIIPETLANGVYNDNTRILEPLYDFWTNDILPDMEKYISECGYQLSATEEVIN